jgi:cytochrome c553
MSAVATYYTQLPAPAIEPAPTEGQLLTEGQSLFEFGKKLAWDKWMPSCFACHARKGEGAGDLFPPLAGQRARYMRQTLLDWQSGKRSGDPNNLMKTIALQLTPAEIDAVAAYVNHMPPEPK